MTGKEIELLGENCPFPIMHIIRAVDMMRPGEKLQFLVDDPLAIKSVPEELEEYPNLSCKITPSGEFWEIVINWDKNK
jgi:TusA-related sulfurtransferase